MANEEISLYFADEKAPVCLLSAAQHFEGLTTQEKLYAHYMSRAAYHGTRIILRQVSEESEGIFDFIITLYHHCHGDFKGIFEQLGLSSNSLTEFTDYFAMFLDNVGNYKSFGDVKFIPRIPKDEMTLIASSSPKTKSLFEEIGEKMYSLSSRNIGFPSETTQSNYYPKSPSITKEEIEAIHKYLTKSSIFSENTRLKKVEDSNGIRFELWVACATETASQATDVKLEGVGDDVEGIPLRTIYGDHAIEMRKIIENLQEAIQYAANDNQKKMLENYISSFATGNMEAFKESQRYWIKDQNPAVETNMGFVETYRDPQGSRAEWDGLVALVNKVQSEKYAIMVELSSEFIVRLPWNGQAGGVADGPKGPFEKEVFQRPDFNSLEILAYSSAQIWSGINIPNFDDIRQTLGFKNVSLANRISASAPKERIPFMTAAEAEAYRRRRPLAFEISVAIHELLGHGSGLLLQETSKGEFNFDPKNPPISPLTKMPVTSWYGIGQTFYNVFGGIGNTIEECRAECVGMFLATEPKLLKLFGCTDETEDDISCNNILYTIYLQMVYFGLNALQIYNPESKKWGQAHERARFGILKCLLEAGPEFLKLSSDTESLSDLTINLDRTKIISHGKPAVATCLQKLQIWRSTADVNAATEYYETLTAVDEYWVKVREVVMGNKQPRKLFIQGNTIYMNGKVSIKEYEANTLGLIRSWVDRAV